jgi:hypothetical protein
MTQKKSQVWIDADLARDCRIMAAKRGCRVAEVASEAIRAGLLLAKKPRNKRATTAQEAK